MTLSTIKDGNYRDSLVALRDYLIAQLERNCCTECGFASHSAAEIAALTLRLHKVLTELEQLGPEPTKKLSGVAAIQARRGGVVDDDSETGSDTSSFGTKKAPRRQGGRRPRVNRAS